MSRWVSFDVIKEREFKLRDWMPMTPFGGSPYRSRGVKKTNRSSVFELLSELEVICMTKKKFKKTSIN